MTIDDLVEAWGVHCAVTYELLALVPDEAMEDKPGKGKTVRSNLTHIVSVRNMCVEGTLGKSAPVGPRLDWKTADRGAILAALEETDGHIAACLRHIDAKAKTWTAPKFLAYMVAHEAHHRSQIEVALRLNGHEPEDKRLYDLWEWAKKPSKVT